MITLSIVLCLFANLIRWAELRDNTTVRSFKDYVNYSDKIVIAYNVAWIILTAAVWLFFYALNN
jgi:hypothetical protein